MVKGHEIMGDRVVKSQVAATILLGLLSLVLYFLLFRYEQEILDLSGRGGWMFVIQITIAFIFSFVHGAFTGNFWDVLGIKAKVTVSRLKQ